MPLVRRIPKRGFLSPFRVEYQIVNLQTLEKLAADGKLQDGVVTPEVLREARRCRRPAVAGEDSRQRAS